MGVSGRGRGDRGNDRPVFREALSGEGALANPKGAVGPGRAEPEVRGGTEMA